MTISEIQKMVHELAKEKGWHEKKRSNLELYALVHSEISEAVEEARSGNPASYIMDGNSVIPVDVRIRDATLNVGFKTAPDGELTEVKTQLKPDGELIELADAVIRIMDICELHGWDLEAAIKVKHEYNKTRSHRHNGKLF